MRFTFTGGHHNSSLALAIYLRDTHHADIQWLGHLHTSLHDKNVSAEYKEVIGAGIVFKDLLAGKLYKTGDIRHLIRVPIGFVQAFYYLLLWRPDMIVSFGGYLAVPVVIVGFLLRIPTVTHEQTVVSGMANRLIARFAKKVFVTWTFSTDHFPAGKVEVVGLPIRKEIFENKGIFNHLDESKKTLYVTAGKQGSHMLNMAIVSVIEKLLETYNVIHQCGSTSEYNDFDVLNNKRNMLSDKAKQRYVVREYIFLEEIGSAYGKADIVISRSGAHTIYELAALKKPAVLIPIPWVSHNEQYKNAQILEKSGSAIILQQSELSGESLITAVNVIDQNIMTFRKNAETASKKVTLTAVETMGEYIINLLK